MQTKRILSLVMALAMLFTLTMPALAWAAEGDEDGNPGDVSSQGDVGTDTVDIGAVGNGENDPADNGSANTGAAGNGESDPADNGSASGAAGNTEGDPADDGIATTGAAGNTEGDPVEGGNPDPGSAAGGDPAAEPTEEPASEEGDGVPPSDPIAAVVGGEAYASFTEALAAALASGAVLELRANAPKEVVLSDGETLLVLAGEFSITVRAAEGCSLSVSDPDAGGVVTYRAAAEAAAPSELPEADPSDDPQPLDDPTPEVSVARVGDEMYATLWEAIDAAPSGATVTLLEAVSETFYVSSNVVLDLNGNSIEANSTVFNYGTLKIIGSGTITGSLSNEGTLTVAGGTMTSVAERTILNKGTLLVSDGTVENRANGVYCAIDNDGGTIRVTGGTVKGCTAIRLSKATEQDGAVDLTVSGGKIQGTDLDIDRADDSAVLSITGGTFAHDPTALLDPAAFCAFPEGDGYAVIPQEVPDDPEISGTCGDDLNWSFEDGVLSINGTGAMYDFENAAAQPWADYSAQITSVSMMEGLTTIGAHAFRQCLELASIDIPDSVTHIGAYAFADNELLTSVSMGSGVTSIGQCAFDGCTGIASIALPDGLISIGAGAFELTGLTSITIPDNVESIEDWAFNSCTSLQSVTIGNGVTVIGNSAFRDCAELASVTIPASVTSIEEGAFDGCTGLANVNYQGTQEQENALRANTDATGNESLLNLTWTRSGNEGNEPYLWLTEDNFPDEHLRECLIGMAEVFFTQEVIAAQQENGVYYLTHDQVMELDDLDVSGEEITSLEGLEAFENAQYITIHDVNLTAVDLSTLPTLKSCDFFGMENLTSVTLPSAVEHVLIEAPLTSLDLSGCSSLSELELYEIDFTTVDVSQNTNLTRVKVVDSEIFTTLVLGSQPKLTCIEIERTGLNSLDISGCPALTVLRVALNNLSELDVSSNLSLEVLQCSGNNLTELNVDDNTKLRELSYSCPDFSNLSVAADTLRSLVLWTDSNSPILIAKSETMVAGIAIHAGDTVCFEDTCYENNYGEAGYRNGKKLVITDTNGGTRTYYLIVVGSGDDAQYSVFDDSAIQTDGAESWANVNVPSLVCSAIGDNEAEYTISGVHLGISATEVSSAPNETVQEAIEAADTAFDVHPEITLNPDSESSVVSDISNSDQIEGKTFPVTLQLGADYADQQVSIAHYTDNGVLKDSDTLTADEYGDVQFTMSSFSIVTVTKVGTSTVSGTCGENLTWSFNPDTGILTIEGTGEMDSAPWLMEYTQQIQSVELPDGLTSICDAAFAFSGLSSVDIPNGVTTIGAEAFQGCQALTAVEVPGSVEYMGAFIFDHCQALTSVTLGEGLTYLPGGMFYGCSALETITIPNSVTELPMDENSGTGVFNDCESLRNVVLPNNLATIGGYCFAGSGLESITIPASVNRIEAYAFSNCRALSDVYYGGTLTQKAEISIARNEGDEAPWGNEALMNAIWHCTYESFASVEVADTEETTTVLVQNDSQTTAEATIPADAFSSQEATNKPVEVQSQAATVVFNGEAASAIAANAGETTDIVLNLTVTEDTAANTKTLDITLEAGGENVFADGTSGTATITIPYAGADENTVVYLVTDDGNGGQVRTPVEIVSFKEGESVTFTVSHFSTYEISQGQASAPASGTCGENLTWTFEETTGTLTIAGNGPMYEFENAMAPWWDRRDSITGLVLENGMTSIGYGAFYGCQFQEVSLPYSVMSIYGRAFEGCSQLQSVSMPDHISTIGSNAFYGCSSLTSIELPSRLVGIENDTFNGCSALTSVTIPYSVLAVYESAFNGCVSLSDVYYYGKESDREKIIVYSLNDELNAAVWHYLSAGTCGNDLTWTFDSTTGALTISGNGAMEDYVSSGMVPWVYKTQQITSVSLPAGLTHIGSYAFSGCSNLTDVYYQGTEEEAAALKAYVGDGNDYLLNAQWYCLGVASGWTVVDVGDFDPYFWAWLLAQGDEGGPWYAKEEDGEAYINLDASWMRIDAELTSIHGVNKFVNLDNLTYEGHDGYRLNTVDLSGMTKLRELNLNWNELTSAALDASGWNKTTIVKLEVGHMGIDDPSFLSGFTALEDLNVSENSFTALDVSAFTTLKRLDCQFNRDLASLTINPGLTDLEMGGTKLNKDNVNFNGAHLTVIKVDDIYFDLATLQSFTDLVTLDVDWYNWGTFDFSPWTKLRDVRCDNSELTSLTLGTQNDLTCVRANDNRLTSLDLRGLNGEVFRELFIGGNSIPALTLPTGTALQIPEWEENALGQRIKNQTLTGNGEGEWSFNVTTLSNAGAVVDPTKVTVEIDGNVTGYDEATGVVTFDAAVESFIYQYDIGDNSDQHYTMPVTVSFRKTVDPTAFDPDFLAWLVYNDFIQEDSDSYVINPDATEMRIDADLTSIRGVNQFVNLEVLTYEGHDGYRLNTVDLSGMTKLTELELWNNSLKTIDISTNTNLYCGQINLIGFEAAATEGGYVVDISSFLGSLSDTDKNNLGLPDGAELDQENGILTITTKPDTTLWISLLRETETDYGWLQFGLSVSILLSDFDNAENRFHSFEYKEDGWYAFDEADSWNEIKIPEGRIEDAMKSWVSLQLFAEPINADREMIEDHMADIRSISFNAPMAFTGDKKLDLSLADPSISVELYHPGASVEIEHHGELSANDDFGNIKVSAGCLTVHGNVIALDLSGTRIGQNENSVVVVYGDVRSFSWYNSTCVLDEGNWGAPFRGSLYVSGRIGVLGDNCGEEYGRRTVTLSNTYVGDNGVFEINVQERIFKKTSVSDDPVPVIVNGKFVLNADEEIKLTDELTDEDMLIKYQSGYWGEWSAFVAMKPLTENMSSSYTWIQLDPEFDETKIVPGENVSLEIAGSAEDHTIVVNGQYDQIDVSGGKVILQSGSANMLEVGNVVINKSAGHPYIDLTIDITVEYLVIKGTNLGTQIVAGEDALIGSGRWSFYLNGMYPTAERSFGSINGSQTIMSNGSFLLMSVDGDGEYGAIAAQIDDLTAAAGITDDNSFAAMEITNDNVELDSLEQALVEAKIPDAIIVTEFEVQVNAYTLDSDGNLADVNNISDLGEAEATFYLQMPTNDPTASYEVVRIHDGAAEVMENTVFDNGQAEVTSSLFSKYVVVKINGNLVTVTFDSNNGSEPFTVSVENGECVPVPTEPEKEGCVFQGWYVQDEDGNIASELFDFENTAITENIKLIAVWDSATIALTGVKYSYNLTLIDYFRINYNVTLPTTYDASKFVLKYSFNGEEPKTAVLSDGAMGNNIYRVVVAEAFAKEMMDTSYIEFFYDGKAVLDSDGVTPRTREVSVRKYCELVINDTSSSRPEKERMLCRAILNYGAAAQKRFRYETNTLANAGFEWTPPYSSIPSSYQSHSEGTCAAATANINLSLLSNVVLNFNFTPAEGYTTEQIKEMLVVTKNGAPISNYAVTVIDGVVRVSILGIKAKELGDLYTVTIGNDSIGMRERSWSPIAWAYAMRDDSKEKEVVLALYNYFKKAEIYFEGANG